MCHCRTNTFLSNTQTERQFIFQVRFSRRKPKTSGTDKQMQIQEISTPSGNCHFIQWTKRSWTDSQWLFIFSLSFFNSSVLIFCEFHVMHRLPSPHDRFSLLSHRRDSMAPSTTLDTTTTTTTTKMSRRQLQIASINAHHKLCASDMQYKMCDNRVRV